MKESTFSRELRDAAVQICDVGRALWQRSLVAANDGNLSIRVGDQVICTPTGVSKGFLTPDRLSLVDLDGQAAAGYPAASSEIKMHLRIYQRDETIKAVVHAHPMFATMWAIQGEPIRCRQLTETVVFLPEVPVARFAVPSTKEVPDSITPYITDYRACLLEHHGALTWDVDLMTAYLNMERLEYTAEITWRLRQAGRERNLGDADIDRIYRALRTPNPGDGMTAYRNGLRLLRDDM